MSAEEQIVDPIEQARQVLAEERQARAERFAEELHLLCEKHAVDLVVTPASITIVARDLP